MSSNTKYDNFISPVELLADLKKKANMKQEDIGEMVGINRSNVSRWSKGYVNPKLSFYDNLVTLYIKTFGRNPNHPKSILGVSDVSILSDNDLAKELEKRGWNVTMTLK